MEQHEGLRARGDCDVDGVLDGAVAPARLVRVIGGPVLRVVDDHIRGGQERGVPRVAVVREERRIEDVRPAIGPPVRRAVGLVIGRIHERGRARGHAVADARRGVI